MDILKKTRNILEYGPICDHCLGRQFAQLLSGYDNAERGHVLRTFLALHADASGMTPEEFKAAKQNLLYGFHALDENKYDLAPANYEECCICSGIFSRLDKIVDRVVKACKDVEFSTFLVGTKLSNKLVQAEETLWEHVGIDYCEPIKAEVNREIGKLIEKRLEKRADLKKPDINIILDLSEHSRKPVIVEINPIFVYGEYQKLKRGIPQTKWPSGKYKISVEQIIAKPFMAKTSGRSHKLHGCGREDIDARCLGWRPFVLEIVYPKKRRLDLKKLERTVNKDKRIKVRSLRASNIAEVRKIKESKAAKTYKCIVSSEKTISNKELAKLKQLLDAEIKQRTPQRVEHRRADKVRKRRVLSISTKLINSKKFELTVKTEAGTYIKELISGDNGRTQPSISDILGVQCKCESLDVIKIHK